MEAEGTVSLHSLIEVKNERKGGVDRGKEKGGEVNPCTRNDQASGAARS